MPEDAFKITIDDVLNLMEIISRFEDNPMQLSHFNLQRDGEIFLAFKPISVSSLQELGEIEDE